ncbi:TPA: hypothetical protein QC096_002244 [Bacillus thuringiensis]|nr:hypothetical protein COK56_25425 [Bacillus cereus]HDR8171069.1 hypothetical protein [Bacillus thuringiensis]
MRLKLEALTNNDLENLSESEIKELLEYEFNEERERNNIYFDAEDILKDPAHKKTLLRILELFLKVDGNSIGPVEDYHRSKSPYDILRYLQQEITIAEETFFYYIGVLYSQRLLTYFKGHEFPDNPLRPFESYIPENDSFLYFDNTLRWRYNFEWLYQNHKNLFKISVPSSHENSYSPPEHTYSVCFAHGSIFELAIHSNLKLTDKGMHFIQSLTNETIKKSLSKTYELNQKLEEEIKKQEESITKQQETISKQNETINKQNETIERQETSIKNHESVTKSLNTKLEEQKKEVNAFYQHIVSILALLVAAFSFIGINISAIPKIEENFAENVIILNLSLILVTTVIFWILKSLIFESDNNNKQQKFWYIITGITLILLITVYGWLGPNAEKHNLNKYKKQIEKQYDNKLDNFKNELEKANLNIENLNKKIDQLENQDKSIQSTQ